MTVDWNNSQRGAQNKVLSGVQLVPYSESKSTLASKNSSQLVLGFSNAPFIENYRGSIND